MMRSGIGRVCLLGASLAAGVAVGCSEQATDSSRIVRPAPGVASSASQAGATPSAGADDDTASGRAAKARFHQKNRLDWIGVAHNAAMDQYARRLREGKVHGNVCSDIAAFVMKRDFFPAAAARMDVKALRDVLRHTVSDGVCAHDAASPLLQQTALTMLDDVVLPGFSPEANALMTQVQTSVSASTTSGALASALGPVVDAAGAMPSSTEADVVLATASVAQSSREYWEAMLTPSYTADQVASTNASYGACFAGYADPASAVSACMGLEHPPRIVRPTRAVPGSPAGPSRALLSFAACDFINMRTVAEQDFYGAG